MNVTIVDYELGNLRSVLGAVTRVGAQGQISRDHQTILNSDKVILPGVGAFGDGMKNLKNLGLIDTLAEFALIKKKPILGICLGAQLLCKKSYEFGEHEGLGWINASVRRFECTTLPVPHVGWNDIELLRETSLTAEIKKEDLFYFVHSYWIDCEDKPDQLAECTYGQRFTAAYQKENIVGVQFHPEKSQRAGLKLLENFLVRT